MEEVKGLLFAFLGGILLDLRWQSIVGLSSFYLVCASYILSFFPKKARFKFGFKMVLLGIGALVFFQLFKFGVYRLLGIEYDVSFIVLIGRVLLDALIFCFVLVLMRVGGLRKLEV
ncbi:MAG: hypothetical protein H5T71_06505 [Chloroflexi bacterium]|nr:hypothetical protein [Chloroflexota bacterium]